LGKTTEADRAIETAMAERARLSDRYDRAIGTGLEQTAYMRLRAATARVAMQGRVAADAARRSAGRRPG
jgi:hypothetical protein